MTTITKLPIDFKGTLASNRREGEEHNLTQVRGRVNRMITPEFGAFYTNSLVVRKDDGTLLIRDKDYVVTYFYDELGLLTSQEICAIIVVINPAVPDTIRISYQAFGGPYSLSVKELKAVLDQTEEVPGKIKWEDIVDKPLQYAPEDHNHEYWQLYGLETTVTNLEMLGRAWEMGRKAVIGDNRIYYQSYILQAQAVIEAYRLKVNAHISDRNNPHKTDKFKIGLGNVENWPLANATQSRSKELNNVYQPIGGIFNQIETHVQPAFDAHINNYNNPHNVLLTDPLLNLWSTKEIQDLYAQRLSRTTRAADSASFAGLPSATIYGNIRAGLDVSNVDPATRFGQYQFAPAVAGMNPNEYVLNGAGKFILFKDALKVHNDTTSSIWFAGVQGNAVVRESALAACRSLTINQNLSVGTFVIGQWYPSYNSRRHSTQLVVQQVTANNGAGGVALSTIIG